MISLFKKISRNNLFKVGYLSVFSNFVKIFSGLFSFKISAYYLGPSGIAVVENIRNFLNIIENAGSLGFQSGVVKYVAENKNDLSKRNHVLSTVFFTLIVISATVSFLFISLSNYIATNFFIEYQIPKNLYVLIGLASPFLILNVYFISVLTALGRYKFIICTNVIGYLLNVLFIYILISLYQLNGAILNLILIPIVLFFISFYFFNKEIGFKNHIRLRFFDFKYIKLLSAFSVMALVSSTLSPIVFLEIRNFIEQQIDLFSAGLWSSLVRISRFYMLFIISFCTLYFYPKLSKSSSQKMQVVIIKQYFFQLVPILALGFTVVFLSKKTIITYLLSSEFEGIIPMFKWQILGDFCKSIAMIFGYYLLANKRIKMFIVLEVLSLGSFYFLSKIFIYKGLNWVVISYFYSNLIYLFSILIVYFNVRNKLSSNYLT